MLAWGLGLAALVYRLRDFGRYGFWNDEAWVALATRVEGLAQFWLSLSTTPLLWAVALEPLSWLPAPPELTLRLLPFVFSLLTLWAAYRTGSHLGGTAGGILALAAIGFDPESIEWAKVLKQYSAEGFFALLAFHQASAFSRGHRVRDLLWLAVVLVVGFAFSNAQLFIAPPLLAALLADALAAGDLRRARMVGAAAAVVGACALAFVDLVVFPHLTASLTELWHGAYVPPGSGPALRFIGGSLARMLLPTWGQPALVVGAVALTALAALVRDQRPVILALVLLVAELAALSAVHVVPFDVTRVMLFALTIVNVYLAGAAGSLAAWLWRRRLWPAAVVIVAVLAAAIATHRRWTALGRAAQVEDLGPLVRRLEAERQADDGVLVYERSLYVYAYYQRRTPLLVPNPQLPIGYALRIDDPDFALVEGRNARTVVPRAFADHRRVWFVGSRFRRGEEAEHIIALLLERGTLVAQDTRQNALLLLIARTAPGE
jgi:hypothetical protein